jgi:hypothetical protein
VRVYIASELVTLKELLQNGQANFAEYLTPLQFEFDKEVDEESREHLISQLAAEDSLELNSGRIGLVIAADLDENQLANDVLTIMREQVAAVFTSRDGEELSWFAQDELEFQMADWER